MTRESAEAFESVLGRIAAANVETASALQTASGLANPRHPAMDLSNTHSDLVAAYGEVTRALDRVEQTLDQLDEDYGSPTPRQLKDEHATRLKEQYDGPVLYLSLMLLEHNRREWLHGKPETNGAESVERHGLVANQREFLNQLQDAWGAYDTEDDDVEEAVQS